MPPDPDRARWMDWLSRLMAWGTVKVPRVAPSRWRQTANRRAGNDLLSEAFTITADDGAKLDGWYFPPPPPPQPPPAPTATAAEPSAAANRLPVFFSHGWTETKEFHIRLARVLHRAGHPVVLYDQRGHGRSQGHCTLAVREPHDLRAVIDETGRRGWAGDRVLTMGVSMGGASVLRHAAADARVAAVVAYAPFTSFLDAIRSYGRRYFRFLSADWGVRGFIQYSRRNGFDIEEANAIAAIGRINVPILLVVGKKDINLPAADHARLLLDAAPPGRAQLIEVDTATHFNICMAQWPGLDEQVLSFLGRGS